MLKLLFPLLLVVLVEGGFFDLTDVEDPLALLWNLPPIRQFTKCKIDSTRNGVCMDKAKCLLTGGTLSGNCGLLFTCCSYEQSCVKTSDHKQSYFEITDLNEAVTSCKYTIKLRNKNVCQVRLDFEKLILAPATLIPSTTEASTKMYACSNDELRITPNNYGVPTLCGYNTNQHVYIHVNQSTETSKAINIDINLASRLSSSDTSLPKPVWKIKFTQLECPVKKSKFDVFKFKDYDDIVNDFSALAPQGVIQYFTESKGQIRSFGFNPESDKLSIASRYPFMEHYTIGFKRPSNVCGIQFNTKVLNLFRQDNDNCYHYLYLPESQITSLGKKLRQNQVLGATDLVTEICNKPDTSEFSSYSPGPLYVNFKAMKTDETPQDTDDQGFQIDYELLNTCPTIV